MVEPILTELQRALTATEPLEALASLTALRAHLDAFEREQVRRARDMGLSYGAIGRGLGLSRQAAHRRYRQLREPPRTLITNEVRTLLAHARLEAAHAGAAEVNCEHVVLALAASGRLGARRVDLEAARELVASTLGGGAAPSRLGRDVLALLTATPGPVTVDALIAALRTEPSCQRLLVRLTMAER